MVDDPIVSKVSITLFLSDNLLENLTGFIRFCTVTSLSQQTKG